MNAAADSPVPPGDPHGAPALPRVPDGGVLALGPRPGRRRLLGYLAVAGWTARAIDGRRCADKTALLIEIGRVFAFPDWFGHNWDALVDCLRDAARTDPPALVIDHPEAVADLVTLTEIVRELNDEGSPVLLVTRRRRGPGEQRRP